MRSRGWVAILASVILATSCGRGSEHAASRSTPQAIPAPVAQPPGASGAEQGPAGSGGIDLSATIGATHYSLKAPGECTYTNAATIHDVPAAMWHATVRVDGQPLSYVNLTVWEFRDHTTQASLGLQVHGDFRHLSTVKGSTLVGSGTAHAAHAGEGATLSLDGTDNRGDAMQLMVRCAKVTAPVEDGGR